MTPKKAKELLAQMPAKILCRSCAAYAECKREKKNEAIKCNGFWEHRPTSDFIKS